MLYGCVRTYERTYKNFFENIVKPNQKDGYEVDIFIHTWDVFEKSGFSWHKDSFPTLNEKKLEAKDIENIKNIYQPRGIKIETLGDKHGGRVSRAEVARLCSSYEQDNNIKYDYYIYTRMDFLFITPFRVDKYVKHQLYLKDPNYILPPKFTFVGVNAFVRMPFLDSRYIPEADLIYFSNCLYENYRPETSDTYVIISDYILHQDFFIQREKFTLGQHLNRKFQLQQKLAPLQKQLNDLKFGTATQRIQNHLSYKLGNAIIENSKSLFGYMRMFYVLSYIRDKHLREQKAYKEKIKANPNLALPPLESYADYNEALKEKECLTYKLGSAFIKACKSWYKGGLVKFYFEAKRLEREFKNKKSES